MNAFGKSGRKKAKIRSCQQGHKVSNEGPFSVIFSLPVFFPYYPLINFEEKFQHILLLESLLA